MDLSSELVETITGNHVFDTSCLSHFKMPWLLNRKMVVNDNVEIMVNAFKLATSSNLFWDILSNTKRDDTINLYCLDLHSLQLALIFCHDGELEVSKKNIHSLFKVATTFKMPTLLKKCERLIFDSLNIDNCLLFRYLAVMWKNDNLIEGIEKFVLKNFFAISERNPQFYELPVNYLLNLLKNDNLNMNDEYILFKITCKWVAYDLGIRLSLMPKIIGSLRLGLLPYEDDLSLIQTHPFVIYNIAQCKRKLNIGRRIISRNRRGLKQLSDIEFCKPRQPHACIIAFGGGMFCAPYRRLKVYNSRKDNWKITSRKFSAPTGRMFFESLVYREHLYMVGGLSERFVPTSSVFLFSFEKHHWVPSPAMHESRFFFNICVLHGHLYAIGGLTDNWVTVKTVERYSETSGEWRYVAPLLVKRNRAACAVMNGKIFICGGISDNNQHFAEHWNRTCEVYDHQTNQWTYIASLPNYAWGCYRLVVCTGHLYLILSQNILKHNPLQKEWTDIETKNMKEHFSFTAVVLDNEVYRICDWTVEKWQPEQSYWFPVKAPNAMLGWGHQCTVIEGVEKVKLFLND